MIIEITGPVFRCKEDENIFLSRLYELPYFINLINKGVNLHLTLKECTKEEVMDAVQLVCDMWGTTFKVLKE